MIEKLLRKQSKLDLTISERRHSYQSNRYNHQIEIYSWKGKLVLEREKIALQRKLYNIALIFFAKLFSQRGLQCKEKVCLRINVLQFCKSSKLSTTHVTVNGIIYNVMVFILAIIQSTV